MTPFIWPAYTGKEPRTSPENVEKVFRVAKEFIDTHELPAPLIAANSWSELTESSHLLPDTLYVYGYLEAIKKVFIDQE